MDEYIPKGQLLDHLFCKQDEPHFDVAKEIADFPAADVAPVVHAQWIMRSGNTGVCNNCNRQDHIDPLATHCRYCGAKMDLEDENDG